MRPLYEALGVTRRRAPGHRPSRPRRSPPRRLRRPTSPTAPTPSSASTTCATTWPPSLERAFQRDHDFAIVDEVDNILIDEARTPLIISGSPEQAADLYYTFARLAKSSTASEAKIEAEGARRVEGHLRGRVRLRVRREAQDRRADRARRRRRPRSSSASRTSTSPSTARSSTT